MKPMQRFSESTACRWPADQTGKKLCAGSRTEDEVYFASGWEGESPYEPRGEEKRTDGSYGDSPSRTASSDALVGELQGSKINAPMRGANAFTLIEILATIGIILMLVTMMVSGYAVFYRHSKSEISMQNSMHDAALQKEVTLVSAIYASEEPKPPAPSVPEP